MKYRAMVKGRCGVSHFYIYAPSFSEAEQIALDRGRREFGEVVRVRVDRIDVVPPYLGEWSKKKIEEE